MLDIEKVTIDLLSSLREELGHDTVELVVRNDIPDLAGCLVEFRPTNPQSVPIGIMATGGAEVASAEVMVGTGWQESWEIEDEHQLQRYRAELEAIVRAAANASTKRSCGCAPGMPSRRTENSPWLVSGDGHP